MFLFVLRQAHCQCMPIKDQKQKDSHADCGIRQVKDRPEENKVLPAPHRHPIRQDRIDQREIEHIDHLTMQPFTISSPLGHKGRHLTKAMVEHDPIEHRIKDIAQRSGQDQRDAGNEAKLVLLLYQLIQEVANETDISSTISEKCESVPTTAEGTTLIMQSTTPNVINKA